MTKRKTLPKGVDLIDGGLMEIGDFLGYKTEMNRGPIKRDKSGVYPLGTGPALKAESRYAYKAHYTFRAEGKSNGADYSDRLMQFDYDKFNRCCKEVWDNEGQYFDLNSRSPEQIERFLQLYYEDDEIKLIDIIEECNASSGYPVWCFRTFSPKWDK